MKNLVLILALCAALSANNAPAASTHAEHQREFGAEWIPGQHPSPPLERPKSPATLSHEVYGFLPYWEYSGYLPARFDLLTRVAYFNITLNSSGNISNYYDWPATALISAAHAAGCAVDLCVAVFSSTTIASIVNSSANRAIACNNICEQMALGADGVNIDFELPNSADKSGFYAFLRELADSVHNRWPERWVSVCLPPVDWSGTFTSDSLLPHLDALFLMGYGYYWSGSSATGPLAPLDDPLCAYDIAYAMNYYCGGDPFKRSRFIVGLPLYGYNWPCSGTSRGSATTGSGTAKIYSTCIAESLDYTNHWDSNAPCPWYHYGSYRQTWWDNARSLDLKYRWTVDNGLMGIGFWALGYDDNDLAFWDGIQTVFAGDIPRDTIIDDVSVGFSYYGDMDFWHTAAVGYLGRMMWTYSTNATDPDDDTCYTIWTPNLPDRRFYELYAYIPSANAVASARYAVNHDFGADTVVVHQTDFSDEWVSLGTYSFEVGAGGSVYLGDGTGTAGQRIGFDAIWWSDRGQLPAPDTLVTLSSNGFRWQGPIQYRRIANGGFEGKTYWTNSITYLPDINGGWWRPNLPHDGDFTVSVFIPEEHSEATVTYQIRHSAGLSTVSIDQSTHSGWVELGTWRFLASDSNYLYVGDRTGLSGQNIAIDAAVWRFAPLTLTVADLPRLPSINAFPNPFNSFCTIEFISISEAVYIYDINGHIIATYDNISNNTRLVWDARDDLGRPLPAGIYFISTSGCYKKITLVR